MVGSDFEVGIGGSAAISFDDNVRLLFGDDDDVVMVLDSAGRSGNAAFAGVLVGTAVYANAIPANSLIISNITAEAERKAFRQQGDHAKAEHVSKMAAVYRTQAAYIQHQYPRTKTLYLELAALRAKETKANRAKV